MECGWIPILSWYVTGGIDFLNRVPTGEWALGDLCGIVLLLVKFIKRGTKITLKVYCGTKESPQNKRRSLLTSGIMLVRLGDQDFDDDDVLQNVTPWLYSD